MVTKKWVLVKRNKQVNALSPCLSNLPPSHQDEMDRWDEGSRVERSN
jgi:hypothetical protein